MGCIPAGEEVQLDLVHTFLSWAGFVLATACPGSMRLESSGAE